jgi:cellular nucleic acid-binding protein
MVYIYTLQLEKEKYYIGKTNNPKFRLDSHFNSNGSEWTKLYKPLKVLELKSNCDEYDEDKVTRQYMDKYGINNVRGGSFVSLKLKKSTIDILQQMSNGAHNRCFACGKPGHFVKDCQDEDGWENVSEDKDEELYVWMCEYCGKEFTEEKKCEYHIKYCKSKSKKYINECSDLINDYSNEGNSCCFRCGRKGHYASSCYASKHIKGYFLK